MTRVCVPILVEDTDAALREARAARDAGADLVEFRVDAFFSGDAGESARAGGGSDEVEQIVALVAASPLPCIVTCRPVLEGGHYDGPDAARVALLERLGTMGGPGDAGPAPRYVDVELSTYLRSENLKQKVNLAVDHPGQVRTVSTELLLSAHDFHTRPPDLLRRLEQMQREPACRVAKIAYRARSLRDNLELLEILAESQRAGRATIALGMGPFGLLSRVLAPKFGGFLTFASLRRSSATAPGQPTLGELLGLYRFRSLGPRTRVFGVVGWPVEHSLSPLMHNAGFEAIEFDGVYLPMPVPGEYEHFKATVLALMDDPNLDLSGLSVTVPHKEHLVRLAREAAGGEAGEPSGADSGLGLGTGAGLGAGAGVQWTLDELSARSGAGNTLSIERDARGAVVSARVTNTDGPALLDVLGPGPRRVVVLGAGGTARAAAAALAMDGRAVTVINRTRARAERLAADLLEAGCGRVGVADEAELPGLAPEAIIHATPAGMAGGPSPQACVLLPRTLDALPAGVVVVDCVYSPRATPLLRACAERAGSMVPRDGTGMLVAQACRQFETWTGRAAPRSLFERIVGETLDAREAGVSDEQRD